MISLNINVDFCSDAMLNRAIEYLKNTNQTTVVIAGGAQLDRLSAYIEKVHASLPKIIIMMRILEDTGIIIKLSPDEWYKRYIDGRPLWFKANNVIPVVDNETSGNDDIIRKYVDNSCAIMDMLHAIDLGGVFCRFATGNIDDGSLPGHTNQYSLLRKLVDKLTDKDWIGPNEYSNAPGKSSSGHLERWKRITALAPGKLINISIGECGILNDYKSRAGWQSIPGLTAETAAASMLADGIWYNGDSISRHAFLVGGDSTYATCQITEPMLKFWEGHYSKIALPPITPPPVTVPPVVVTPPPPPAIPAVLVTTDDLQGRKVTIQANILACRRGIMLMQSMIESLTIDLANTDNLIKLAK